MLLPARLRHARAPYDTDGACYYACAEYKY